MKEKEKLVIPPEIAELMVLGHLILASEYEIWYNKQVAGFVREVELIANYDLGASIDVKKILRNG
jgi:hypothetical protein